MTLLRSIPEQTDFRMLSLLVFDESSGRDGVKLGRMTAVDCLFGGCVVDA